jgi:methylase of polypeptide subunit release factors
MGTGSGVGAIIAGSLLPKAQILATDINAKALRFARINAAGAGVPVQVYQTDRLDAVPGPIDIAIANPPYLVDDAGRTYRHGGGMNGASVSIEMARMALDRLSPRGRLLLYTGSAIINGQDALRQALAECAEARGSTLRYREIDPDVFGEELEKPAYQDVDRIALVAAVIERA